MIERRFYNAKDMAHYLGISEDSIRKWAIRGRIPYSKFGKSLRFDLRKIETWIKDKECAYVRKAFN